VIKRRSEQSRKREVANDWHLDLSGPILNLADLEDAHLEGANLRGAHLEGTILSGEQVLDAYGDALTELSEEVARPALAEAYVTQSSHGTWLFQGSHGGDGTQG
jgi:hypothetical protein